MTLEPAQDVTQVSNAIVTRFDSIKLLTRTDGLPKVRRTKEKYLYGEAPVTKTGVFLYRNADGSVRRELRHPDDVFDLESLKSLVGLPITLDHPPEFVDADNAHKYDKGGTGDNYRIQDKLVIASLTIRHLEAINAVLDGHHELSAAYTAELIFEKGIYEGEEYDCRQVNIRYNHIAIVKWGRAGREVRLRFDSAAELVEEVTGNNETTEDNINNLKQEEITPMKEEVKVMDENIQFRVDALNEELNILKTENSALQKRLDAAEQELAKEKELKAESIIARQVMDRAEILVGAAPYLGDVKSYLGKPDRDIMIEAMNVNRADAADSFDGRSDDFVRGAFNSFVNADPKNNGGNNNTFTLLNKRQDSSMSKSIHEQIAKQFKQINRV